MQFSDGLHVTENAGLSETGGGITHSGTGSEEDTHDHLRGSLQSQGFFVTRPQDFSWKDVPASESHQISMDRINKTIDKLKVAFAVYIH